MDERFANDFGRDDELILVDMFDQQTSVATKMRAHLDDQLHRAFSVVLMREGKNGPELLLSKRSRYKYHSQGLWANSCCSHPRNGEDTLDAAYRRTHEELGTTAVDLCEIGAFVYRSVYDGGISEYEYDHVFLGYCTQELDPDPIEVSDVRWIEPEALSRELTDAPDAFATWTITVFPLVFKHLGL